MSKKKPNRIFTFVALTFFLAVLPLGSWYFLQRGYDRSLEIQEKMKPKGEVSSFELVDQDGQIITNDSLKGKWYVADFFFSKCPNECLAMAENLQLVQEKFEKNENFVILSFTTDPANDTISALKEYADNLGAMPGKWYFLRGEQQEIFKLAKEGFKLPADIKDNDNDIIHSPYFTVVDGDGQLRGYFDGTDKEAVYEMVQNLGHRLPRKADAAIQVKEGSEL